jgi:hypothetical protein
MTQPHFEINPNDDVYQIDLPQLGNQDAAYVIGGLDHRVGDLRVPSVGDPRTLVADDSITGSCTTCGCTDTCHTCDEPLF